MIKLNGAILDGINSKQHDAVFGRFADTLAAGELSQAATERRDALAEHAGAHEGEARPVTVAQMVAMAKAGASPAQLMGGQQGPVPIGALRLYRSLAARTAMAVSLSARAASTTAEGGPVERTIGDFEFSLVRDVDAAFIVIRNVADEVPTSLFFLGEDGETSELALPEPVDGGIQLMIPLASADGRKIVTLAADDQTAIFLH